MHEQSAFFSAPVLAGLAFAIAGVALTAEIIVRSDDDTGIVRTISSDDQQEIERTVASDLDEDFQADLIALVQDGWPVLGVIDQPYTGERFIGAAGLAQMR